LTVLRLASATRGGTAADEKRIAGRLLPHRLSRQRAAVERIRLSWRRHLTIRLAG
jgi:hypothetical protein